jgi:hypothetical protein
MGAEKRGKRLIRETGKERFAGILAPTCAAALVTAHYWNLDAFDGCGTDHGESNRGHDFAKFFLQKCVRIAIGGQVDGPRRAICVGQ